MASREKKAMPMTAMGCEVMKSITPFIKGPNLQFSGTFSQVMQNVKEEKSGKKDMGIKNCG
jgi:hypothetical protein